MPLLFCTVLVFFARLEQFNDVFLQENSMMDVSALGKISSPPIDLPGVDLLLKKKSLIVELPKVLLSFLLKLNEFNPFWYLTFAESFVQSSQYSNVVCLGMEDGIPILTFTYVSFFSMKVIQNLTRIQLFTKNVKADRKHLILL